MPTAVKTWAKVRAPVGTDGTGGTTVLQAIGGLLFVMGIPKDLNNVIYEGPVYLTTQETLLRTDFNPYTNIGTYGFPQQVRTPYFTANSPLPLIGSFVEWTATSTVLNDQTLTEDQKGQLIGQIVTTTTGSFTMTSDAFFTGQIYTPGFEYIVEIGNLAQV